MGIMIIVVNDRLSKVALLLYVQFIVMRRSGVLCSAFFAPRPLRVAHFSLAQNSSAYLQHCNEFHDELLQDDNVGQDMIQARAFGIRQRST